MLNVRYTGIYKVFLMRFWFLFSPSATFSYLKIERSYSPYLLCYLKSFQACFYLFSYRNSPIYKKRLLFTQLDNQRNHFLDFTKLPLMRELLLLSGKNNVVQICYLNTLVKIASTPVFSLCSFCALQLCSCKCSPSVWGNC